MPASRLPLAGASTKRTTRDGSSILSSAPDPERRGEPGEFRRGWAQHWPGRRARRKPCRAKPSRASGTPTEKPGDSPHASPSEVSPGGDGKSSPPYASEPDPPRLGRSARYRQPAAPRPTKARCLPRPKEHETQASEMTERERCTGTRAKQATRTDATTISPAAAPLLDTVDRTPGHEPALIG